MTYTLIRSVLLCAALVCSSMAATLYVDKQGDDSNPGSQQQPFVTVERGLEAVRPGDTLSIGPGLYEEYVYTEQAGTPTDRIIVDGQNQATILGFGFRDPFVTLQNITVSGTTGPGNKLIYMDRGAHYSIVSNVVVDGQLEEFVGGIVWRSPSSKPFNSDAASHCLLVSNDISRILGTTAVSMYGDNNRMIGNFVHDVGQADFIRLWGRGNLISANTFSNNYRVEGIGNHIDFIQTFGDNGYGSMDHVIERNFIMGVDGQFSQLSQDAIPEIRGWTFRYNVSVRVALQASCTMPGNTYHNNVFYQCNYANGGHALTFGGRQKDPPELSYWAHDTRVFNNVFLDCGDSTTNKGWYSFNTNLTGCVADYNFVAKNGYQTVRVGSVPVGNGDHGNFSFFELHGINGGNPLFVDEGGFNFRPTATSFLVDNGKTGLGSEFDFAGAVVPQGGGPDIGAYEFFTSAHAVTPQRPTNLHVVDN